MHKRSALIFSHFGLALAVLLIAIFGNYFYDYISVNLPRLAQFIDAISGGSGVGAIGTYNNRLEIYNALWHELSSSSTIQIIFGHGTSSAGYIFAKKYLNGHIESGVDPNRIVHDEFLRSLYEWGFLGLLTFVSFLFVIFVWLTTTYIKSRKEIYAGAIYYLISLCIYLKTENIFAGAGSAVTMGFALLLGVIWQESEYKRPVDCRRK